MRRIVYRYLAETQKVCCCSSLALRCALSLSLWSGSRSRPFALAQKASHYSFSFSHDASPLSPVEVAVSRIPSIWIRCENKSSGQSGITLPSFVLSHRCNSRVFENNNNMREGADEKGGRKRLKELPLQRRQVPGCFTVTRCSWRDRETMEQNACPAGFDDALRLRNDVLSGKAAPRLVSLCPGSLPRERSVASMHAAKLQSGAVGERCKTQYCHATSPNAVHTSHWCDRWRKKIPTHTPTLHCCNVASVANKWKHCSVAYRAKKKVSTDRIVTLPLVCGHRFSSLRGLRFPSFLPSTVPFRSFSGSAT